ncbi:hypothetical protein GGG16DRAFT_129850 [Schizophyllum commune]
MDMITSASDEPGDHDTPSDIEVSGSSVGQLQNYASLGDLLNQVEALSLSIRRLEEENRLQGRELSSLMDVDDANARMVRLENDRFRRAIVTKDENITALQATADSLQRRWQKHVAGESSGSASMHLDIAVCPVQSRGHYDRYFPLRDLERCIMNRDTWRIILNQLKRLESAEARAQLRQEIINKIKKEISLVQPSAPSCILGNPDRGPSTFALEESDGSMKEPVKIKKNANKIAKQRNENTARNHCLRDWLEDHPRGTNGQFDAHWRSIRADANLLKPYQDRARKDVVAGKAKLNADKPAKLSQKNTARFLFRQIT